MLTPPYQPFPLKWSGAYTFTEQLHLHGIHAEIKAPDPEDASLLHFKDQSFNYFKSILQHEMFPGTPAAVSQIRWEDKLHTSQPLRHPIVSVPPARVYHTSNTTAVGLLMTLTMKSLLLLRQIECRVNGAVSKCHETKGTCPPTCSLGQGLTMLTAEQVYCFPKHQNR